MQSYQGRERGISGLRFVRMVAIYLLAVAGILVLTWPWALHMSGEFINHWDPPFHAWKLEFMARAILSGDPLLLHTQANVLYPYTDTLYFEALQWPPAWLAALLLLLTKWPFELIYHVTLVAFWALSAPCYYLLLRGLRLSRPAAVTGAMLFTLLPYRISYMVEFQMELACAIPLYFLALIRFLRGQTLATALLLVLAWWLQAVSELYQAVMLILVTPFIAAPFIAASPAMLRSRHFWRALAAALLAGGLLLYPLLFPYFTQHTGGAVKRSMSEIVLHAAQPLSYLAPFNNCSLWTINARIDELSLYPTVIVLLLAAITAFVWFYRGYLRRSFNHSMRLIVALLTLVLALFLLITLLFLNDYSTSNRLLVRSWDMIACLSVALAVALVLLPEEKATTRQLFLRGLLGAAIFTCFLSFGPSLSVGRYNFDITTTLVHTRHSLFRSAYKYWLPLLSGFRVVSRFGIIVLFFLVTAASFGLELLLRHLRRPIRWHQCLRLLLPPLVLLLMGIEANSLPIKALGYRPVDHRSTPVLERLESRQQPFVLAMIPMGDRMHEGMRMFTLLRHRYLSVFAWGGHLPNYSRSVRDTVGRLYPEHTLERLSMLWPEALLLIDHQVDSASNETPDYTAIFSACATPIDQDERFTLMQLQPPPPALKVRRLFRNDFAKRAPFITTLIQNEAAATITVMLNGHSLENLSLPAGTNHFQYKISPRQLVKAGANELSFISDNVPISLLDFKLCPTAD